MFGIFSGNKPAYIEGEFTLMASIIIDDFSDIINIPLDYWSIKDYRYAWRRSIEEGLANKKHSALTVSMYGPDYINILFVWVLYFEGESVFVQNQLLSPDKCLFRNADRINDFINPRAATDEDGMKIPEWTTDLQSVITFSNSLIE